MVKIVTVDRKICSLGLKNNPNRQMKSISYITIHNTGNYNANATAKMHTDYLYRDCDGRQVSWHYTVDKDEIWQSFEDNQECWHAGDGSGGPGNYTSIGIEICVNEKDAFRKNCENAAWLTAELLRKHKLSIDKVVQHNKWSGKDCPAELRSGRWGVDWDSFIAMVQSDMALSQNPIDSTDNINSNEPSNWANDSWEWGKLNGITDGTTPKNNITREQVVKMLHNFSKLT